MVKIFVFFWDVVNILMFSGILGGRRGQRGEGPVLVRHETRQTRAAAAAVSTPPPQPRRDANADTVHVCYTLNLSYPLDDKLEK